MDASGLLAQLHGRAFRHICVKLSAHFSGLAAASRAAHRLRLIDSAMQKQLYKLDAAFALTRHISAPLAEQFFQKLEDQLNTEKGQSTVHHLNTESDRNTVRQLNTENGRTTAHHLNTKGDQSTGRQLNTENGQDTAHHLNTKGDQSTERQLSTENGQSPWHHLNTEGDQNTERRLGTENGQSPGRHLNTKVAQSTERQLNTESDHGTLHHLNTKGDQSTERQLNTENGQSIGHHLNTEFGNKASCQDECTSRTQPSEGLPPLPEVPESPSFVIKKGLGKRVRFNPLPELHVESRGCPSCDFDLRESGYHGCGDPACVGATGQNSSVRFSDDPPHCNDNFEARLARLGAKKFPGLRTLSSGYGVRLAVAVIPLP